MYSSLYRVHSQDPRDYILIAVSAAISIGSAVAFTITGHGAELAIVSGLEALKALRR